MVMTFIPFYNEFLEKYQSLTCDDSEICVIDFSRLHCSTYIG